MKAIQVDFYSQYFGDQMFRNAGRPFCCLSLLLLAGIATAHLSAQTSSGAIAGSIQDASGAVVPNTAVTATNNATHSVSVTKSTSSGAYRFPNLPLGAYTVTAVASGFSTATETGVIVQINSTTALDIKLTPGQVSESVTVDASGL